jgi:hypothetical protein
VHRFETPTPSNIEAEVRNLSASVADVRQTSAEQHRENRERLESIGERVEKIEADVKPLAKTVATMEPIVAGYIVTHWKIAGALALGTTMITAWMDRVAVRRQDCRLDLLMVPLIRPPKRRVAPVSMGDAPNEQAHPGHLGASARAIASAKAQQRPARAAGCSEPKEQPKGAHRLAVVSLPSAARCLQRLRTSHAAPLLRRAGRSLHLPFQTF